MRRLGGRFSIEQQLVDKGLAPHAAMDQQVLEFNESIQMYAQLRVG